MSRFAEGAVDLCMRKIWKAVRRRIPSALVVAASLSDSIMDIRISRASAGTTRFHRILRHLEGTLMRVEYGLEDGEPASSLLPRVLIKEPMSRSIRHLRWRCRSAVFKIPGVRSLQTLRSNAKEYHRVNTRAFDYAFMLENLNHIGGALELATGIVWRMEICAHMASSTIAGPDGIIATCDRYNLMIEVMNGDLSFPPAESFVTLKQGDQLIMRLELESCMYVPVMKAIATIIDKLHQDLFRSKLPWRRARQQRLIARWNAWRATQQFDYHDRYIEQLHQAYLDDLARRGTK